MLADHYQVTLSILAIINGAFVLSPSEVETGERTSVFRVIWVHYQELTPCNLLYPPPRSSPCLSFRSVHLTVNSVLRCPFCTGLHGELGR